MENRRVKRGEEQHTVSDSMIVETSGTDSTPSLSRTNKHNISNLLEQATFFSHFRRRFRRSLVKQKIPVDGISHINSSLVSIPHGFENSFGVFMCLRKPGEGNERQKCDEDFLSEKDRSRRCQSIAC